MQKTEESEYKHITPTNRPAISIERNFPLKKQALEIKFLAEHLLSAATAARSVCESRSLTLASLLAPSVLELTYQKVHITCKLNALMNCGEEVRNASNYSFDDVYGITVSSNNFS